MFAQLVAIQASPTAALAHVAASERIRVGRLLDQGADGLVIPRLESVAAVRETVSWMRYPPAGIRGVATGTRVDLVFRIDPGPGNYVTKGNRASALVNRDPAHPFFATYLSNNGPFGTPGGHGQITCTW